MEYLLAAAADPLTTGPASLPDMVDKYGFLTLIGCLVLYFLYQLGTAFMVWFKRMLNGKSKTTRHDHDAALEPKTMESWGSGARHTRKLRDHQMFMTVETLITVKVTKLTCVCPGRTELFRDICRTSLQSWRDSWYRFLEEDHSGDSEQRLMNSLVSMLIHLQQDVKSSLGSQGIPKAATDIFDTWTSPRMDKLQERGKDVAGCSFYHDNLERIGTVMYLHELSMELLVLNMQWLIRSLNGRLDGHVYKGYTIQPVYLSEGQHNEDIGFNPPALPAAGSPPSEGYRRIKSDEIYMDSGTTYPIVDGTEDTEPQP
jgi:hypothetical protein